MGEQLFCSARTENNATKEFDIRKRGNGTKHFSVLLCGLVCILDAVFHYFVLGKTRKNPQQENRILPFVFKIILTIFSVVLTSAASHFSLINEERHHLIQRHGRSWNKMTQACFSGVLWGHIFAILLLAIPIAVYSISKGDKTWEDFLPITSGMGIGFLFTELFNLNKQSSVHISTILEEHQAYPANSFAWYYYYNYLEEALPKFKKLAYKHQELSLKKLLLLIPIDCHTEGDLSDVDEGIQFVHDMGDTFSFPVYNFSDGQNTGVCAIQYIKYPLKTLRTMRDAEGCKAVNEANLAEQVKLFYTTLGKIIESPPEQNCEGTCTLIPIATYAELKNGALLKCILDIIHKNSDASKDSLKVQIEEGKNAISVTGISKELVKDSHSSVPGNLEQRRENAQNNTLEQDLDTESKNPDESDALLQTNSSQGESENKTMQRKKGNWTMEESVDKYLNQQGKRRVPVKKDGHCILNAFIHGLKEIGTVINAEELIGKIFNEVTENFERYSNFFDKSEDWKAQLTAYRDNKVYNSSLVDLIPNVLANITETSISIVCVDHVDVHTIQIGNLTQDNSKPEIFMAKFGDHYDAILSVKPTLLSQE